MRQERVYQSAPSRHETGKSLSECTEIIPLWDWTKLYTDQCLVANPLYQAKVDPELSDCEICEGINSIDRVRQMNDQDILDYLSREMPVVVEDGTWDWGSANNITLQQLSQMYTDHPVLKDADGCSFISNLRSKNSKLTVIMNMLGKGQLDNFYAQWENCNFMAAKAIRKIYKRPYFLSPVVSVASTNWMLISANYSGKIYKAVDIPEKMLLFMQVRGESLVRIQAREPCLNLCSQFEDTLQEGEILVATTFIWTVDYIPSNSPENIAIVLGATYE